MKVGERNLVTDVAGLLVGNASDENLKSGSTVLTADKPFAASVHVMGGAPGSRETELLAPDKLVDAVDAIVLSGGSVFGLDAGSGVTNRLREANRGFEVGSVRVPIVPGAIIFDLLNGGDKRWRENPYAKLGRRAFEHASDTFELGTQGAGVGAMTANVKGGLGSASVVLSSGHTVAALIVANPIGSTNVPGHPHFWAAPFEVDDEFGDLGACVSYDPLLIPQSEKTTALNAKANTTIGVVATDAVLTKAQLQRLAVSAHDGISRAIVPAHTPFDGDMIFAVSTRVNELDDPAGQTMQLGHAAAVCVSRAIARGVFEAVSSADDLLPSWREKWK